jgi:hypothetical protein
MRPRSWNHSFFSSKIPLTILDKQVVSQEQDRQGQHEEETVVEIPIHKAVVLAQVVVRCIPGHVNDFGV